MNDAKELFDLDFAKRFISAVPHMVEIGIDVVEGSEGEWVMRLPYNPDHVGHPETGVIHGGVITTLIDSICGLAVFSSLGAIRPIATLDLRIDYLKPATAERDIFAFGQCYKMTRSVAFVRAVAYHEQRDDPIANTVATFMIGSPGPVMQAKPKAAAEGGG